MANPYQMKFFPPAIAQIIGSIAGGAAQAVFAFLDRVMNWMYANTQPLTCDAVCTLPLPANTYANGTSGAGATLTANANGAFPTIDGVAPLLGQLYLVANEALGAPNYKWNGLYKLTTLGSSSAAWVLTRVTNFDQSAEMIPGQMIGVKFGTLYAGTTWLYLGPSAPTVGTTALYFAPSPRIGINAGIVPSSRLVITGNPANTDPAAIGATNIQFLTTLIAATTYAQVKRGATAALTLTNLIAYINNDTTNANWVESTTPPTWKIVADNPTGTQLRIRLADQRGGKPIAGISPTTALTCTITGGPAAWLNANLNETGSATYQVASGIGKATISSADITAGTMYFEFPFTPTGFKVQAYSSAGVQRAYSDVTAISGDAVAITLGGGASPNLQANDAVYVEAWQ